VKEKVQQVVSRSVENSAHSQLGGSNDNNTDDHRGNITAIKIRTKSPKKQSVKVYF